MSFKLTFNRIRRYRDKQTRDPFDKSTEADTRETLIHSVKTIGNLKSVKDHPPRIPVRRDTSGHR